MGQQQKRNQRQAADGTARPRNAEEQKAEELLRRAQEKHRRKQQAKASPDRVTDKGPIAFVKGTGRELKAATWPSAGELVKWCLIVLGTVAIVSILAMVIDNFLATPIIYFISSFSIADGNFGWLAIVLCVLLFLSGIGAVIGIYLHQGGETEGLSDTLATKLTGGSGQAQKNLDKITLVCIIVFIACVLAMIVVIPEGSIIQK